MIRVITLFFVFLIRLRFPVDKSIAEIIRSRYGDATLKVLRKYETVDFKLRKAYLHLDFLERCLHHDLIPKFLWFKLSHRNLRNSSTYLECQRKLLKEEMNENNSNIRPLNKKFESCQSDLKGIVSYIDFTHVSCLFLANNDRNLEKAKEVQKRKLYKLGLKGINNSHDPNDVIHKYSSHELHQFEKSFLSKGLKFPVPPSKVGYADYLVPFECLYRDIKNFEMSTESRDFLKARTKDAAISSFNSFNEGHPHNLSKEEINALKSLASKIDLVIQKSDKGNSVVLIVKNVYVSRVESLLSDTSKFQKIPCLPDKELNFIINREKEISNVLHKLFENEKLDKRLYNKLKPRASKIGSLYGL